jgi:succinoglycan biosynthesis protein ExoA
MNASPRRVSIIVPCRNERRYVGPFCAAVLAQTLPPGWSMQLVVADGMSEDGTREVLERIAQAESCVRWIDNPDLVVSAGLNRALVCADGEVIVRMDVHTEYASNYIAECIAVLAETHADNVGGAWRAASELGAGATQQAIAAAFQSRWVAGGALSRRLDHEGWADTVYLGCWPRATFERFGVFDESLVRNQDDEHNLRLIRNGGGVWQSPRIRSIYRPRSSLVQLFRQYLQYGYWKPFVIRKHGRVGSARHLVPALFVAGSGLLLVVSLLGASMWPFLTLLLLYAAVLVVLTLDVAHRERLDAATLALVPLVIAAYHVGYGIGSILGWCDVLRGAGPNERFTTLTR